MFENKVLRKIFGVIRIKHNVEHNELYSLSSTVQGVKYTMGWALGRMGEARNIWIYH
jgi:hypothetical protein